jgi:hypothetical protein
MSQHDLVIANGAGAVVRADINSALQALGTLSSGLTEPSTKYPYMLWADTTTGLLKMRNAGNTAWITLGELDTDFGIESFPAGTKIASFYQDTAPPGWTILNTLDDKLLYITKGSAAGGQAGGTVHSTGSWTISGFAADVGSHTLTVAEMPAHPHGGFRSASWQMGAAGNEVYVNNNSDSATASVGGDQAHNHAMAAHGGTWRPSAYCAIICQKS